VAFVRREIGGRIERERPVPKDGDPGITDSARRKRFDYRLLAEPPDAEFVGGRGRQERSDPPGMSRGLARSLLSTRTRRCP
jgi:hypothetical protein